MSSSRFLTATLTVMVTGVAFYIFYVTFGPAFDMMGMQFAEMLPKMNLPTPWFNLGIKVLSYWKYVYSSVVIIMISMMAWIGRLVFFETDFQRQY